MRVFVADSSSSWLKHAGLVVVFMQLEPLLLLRGITHVLVVQVIKVCEKLADCDAQVNQVPVAVLKAARNFLRSFQWAKDASDRLAFAEVLDINEDFTADMTEAYKACSLSLLHYHHHVVWC
jgi:hypothetical protein